mmetsp:Transcript_5058/g.13113  ORF Transcript_5058/g.13113 Transcript_5058/m.13113 type:complete len:248 (+) Transcript_5058:2361-3104(+)
MPSTSSMIRACSLPLVPVDALVKNWTIVVFPSKVSTVSFRDFLDRVSDALSSITSYPSSLQTRCAVVVLPTPGPPIIRHAPNSHPSSDAFFGLGPLVRRSLLRYQLSSHVRNLLAGLLAPFCPATIFEAVGAYLTDHNIEDPSLLNPGVPLYVLFAPTAIACAVAAEAAGAAAAAASMRSFLVARSTFVASCLTSSFAALIALAISTSSFAGSDRIRAKSPSSSSTFVLNCSIFSSFFGPASRPTTA